MTATQEVLCLSSGLNRVVFGSYKGDGQRETVEGGTDDPGCYRREDRSVGPVCCLI